MTRQDHGVPEPRVRLRVLLALLRAAAGARGDAAVAWHGAGFTYVLSATRSPVGPHGIDLDADPDAHRLEDVRAAIADALEVAP